MKKIIALLLCFAMAEISCCALNINDNFVDNTLDKNLKIKKYKFNPIEDEFAQLNKNKNLPKKLYVVDEILPDMPAVKYTKKPVFIDGENKEIKIKIKEFYTTKSNLDEGDIIEFITLEDVELNGQKYPKNSIVKARLETISKNKSYGVPSDLVVGNFRLDDNMLAGEISKTGANRTLWVRPLVYATSWFFLTGLLFISIRGGHAKIRPKETFVLYGY